MKSMTGFGKSVYDGDDYHIELELKSVNSRFLEIRLTLPRELSFLELEISNLIKTKINRGKISGKLDFVSYESTGLMVNEQKFHSYNKIYSRIKELAGSKDEIPLSLFLGNEEIIFQSDDISGNETLQSRILGVVAECIEEHQLSSLKEGNSMLIFLRDSAARVLNSLKNIQEFYPGYKERINIRLQESAQNLYSQKLTEEDLNRLALELAIYVEKADINEEIVRLYHHTDKFISTLTQDGDKGKTLNFILQEMHREINTIGSKFNENEIFDDILLIKEEIEKCRELVQNVV
ncbi:MAG: DUF1732 domain-containing protein [Candidatus Cloacimonetes bacterium]|nr:DUF1732 domain-containing protein [Candidatus Cloacimonadota bacterium]